MPKEKYYQTTFFAESVIDLLDRERGNLKAPTLAGRKPGAKAKKQ